MQSPIVVRVTSTKKFQKLSQHRKFAEINFPVKLISLSVAASIILYNYNNPGSSRIVILKVCVS